MKDSKAIAAKVVDKELEKLDAEDQARIDEMLGELTPAERAYAVKCLSEHAEPDGDEPVAVETAGGAEIPLDPEKMFKEEDEEDDSESMMP